MIEYKLRLDQAGVLNGRLMPPHQSERSAREGLHGLQNRQMAGMANRAAMRRVIIGVRCFEGSGLREGSHDQQQDQDHVP